MKNFTRIAVVGAVSAVFANSAFASGIDTAGVMLALTEAGQAAATVGAAVLIVVVGIKAFKFIKGAL